MGYSFKQSREQKPKYTIELVCNRNMRVAAKWLIRIDPPQKKHAESYSRHVPPPKKKLQCTDLAKPLNWSSFLVALRRTCFGFHRGPAKPPGCAPWNRIAFLLQGLQLFPQGRCLVTGSWWDAVRCGWNRVGYRWNPDLYSKWMNWIFWLLGAAGNTLKS